MLINKNKEYNPKIDYLICKNLINYLPKRYDEYHLRKVFLETEEPVEQYEKDIVRIKLFFEGNDALNLKLYQIENLLEIILKDKFDYFQYYESFNKEFSYQYLVELIKCLQNEDEEIRKVVLKICILLSSLINNEIPLIPSRNIIRKLSKVNIEDHDFIKRLYCRLLSKRDKYLLKHDMLENKKALNALIIKSKEIGLLFKCTKIGIYGSFATKEDNEYSDLDILIVMNPLENKEIIRKEILLYLKEIINIPIDVKIVDLLTMNQELTIGMKKSLKIIWEE